MCASAVSKPQNLFGLPLFQHSLAGTPATNGQPNEQADIAVQEQLCETTCCRAWSNGVNVNNQREPRVIVRVRARRQEVLQSPDFVDDPDSKTCRYCQHKFKNAGGRIEHEKFCREGPRQGFAERGLEAPELRDDDVEDTLLCDVCDEEIGNRGALATHRTACLASKAAAEARGENFVSSIERQRERQRRLTYTFSYKQRAIIEVESANDRDQRDVPTMEKELRARQHVAKQFKAGCALVLRRHSRVRCAAHADHREYDAALVVTPEQDSRSRAIGSFWFSAARAATRRVRRRRGAGSDRRARRPALPVAK